MYHRVHTEKSRCTITKLIFKFCDLIVFERVIFLLYQNLLIIFRNNLKYCKVIGNIIVNRKSLLSLMVSKVEKKLHGLNFLLKNTSQLCKILV